MVTKRHGKCRKRVVNISFHTKIPGSRVKIDPMIGSQLPIGEAARRRRQT